MRESRKKNTKELIVRHAVRLFKEKGFDRVTVEEITQACGIAKGTFFNYFPRKESVLLHLADSYSELMSGIFRNHRDGRPKERLMSVFREFLRLYMRHADLLRRSLVESMKAAIESQESSANLSAFQESIRAFIEEAKATGSLRSRIDSSACASVLAAVFYHTLIRWSAGADEEQIAAVLQRQLDAVWEGLADETAQEHRET